MNHSEAVAFERLLVEFAALKTLVDELSERIAALESRTTLRLPKK
jgi:hypothetical protein